MLVLVAVPGLQAHKLHQAAGRDFELAPVASWEAALTLIRTRPVEIAVVDPLLGGGEPRAQEIERILVLFPSLPLIVYTTLNPTTATLLLRFGRRGIRQAVFTRFDDHPDRLRAILLQERRHSAAQRQLEALSTALDPLPTELRWALEAVLTNPGEVQTVSQLAARARVDRRTCQRWFSRLGLPSPRAVLAAARLLYAHRLLQDPGYTIEDVAEKLGYGQVKTLQMHAREMLGLTPGELRIALDPDEALAIVVRRLFTTEPQLLRQKAS